MSKRNEIIMFIFNEILHFLIPRAMYFKVRKSYTVKNANNNTIFYCKKTISEMSDCVVHLDVTNNNCKK